MPKRHIQIDTADRIRPTDLIEVHGKRVLVEGADPAVDGWVLLAVSDPHISWAQSAKVIRLAAGLTVTQHRDRAGYRSPLTPYETHTSVADALVAAA